MIIISSNAQSRPSISVIILANPCGPVGLNASDVGSATRSTSYYTDTNLPPNFYRVTDSDYNGVGNIDFNRGHLCPSEDRTDTSADNKLVFSDQHHATVRAEQSGGVGDLETYCRSMLTTNELLIICGPSEFGTNKIPSGKAYIGSNVWKIVVCVPLGSGMALSRIGATNRVIAVSIPNVTNGLSSAWQTYVTSPLQIEHDTGFHFFTALPPDVAQALRLKIDGKASVPLLSAVNLASTGFSFTVTGSAGQITLCKFQQISHLKIGFLY